MNNKLIICLVFLSVMLLFAERTNVVKTRTELINEVINDNSQPKKNKLKAVLGKPEAREMFTSDLISIAEKITSNNSTNKANLITLNFKDADLRNILRMIARSAQINIIAGPEVKGSVTMELNKVDWEQALSLVLGVNGYTYLKEGNIIRIVSADRVEQEPLAIAVIPLKFAKSDEVLTIIKPLLTPQRGKIESDPRANVLIINDIPTKISQIQKIVDTLDQQTPQVLIEVNFVEIAVGETDTIGVDWSDMSDYGILLHDMLYTFDKSIDRSESRDRAHGTEAQKAQATRNYGDRSTKTFAYQLTPDDFRLAFSMLANDQRVKIISNPKIQTLDNRKATIRVAETHYKPTFTYNKETGAYEINNLEDVYVGITLDVTPHINLNGYVTLDILPTVSALAGNQVIQGVEVPIVNERTIDARVALKDKYTIAIGGMIKDDWGTSKNSIPYLGDLPYVGSTFFSWEKKEKKKDNLVIFITATIVKPEERHPGWKKQLREMHLKYNGEFDDVITNYPTWHRMVDISQIKEREKALIIAAATNGYVNLDYNYNFNPTE